MRKHIGGAALAALLALPVAAQAPAIARDRNHHDYRWDGNRDSRWDPADHYRGGKYRARRLVRADHIYRGHDGRWYCRRNDGTTGLVIGAIGGGLLGNAISNGGTLGTIIGAGGGALLGRQIDRGQVRCR